MRSASARYHSHKRKQAISHAAARKRSLKGWESRRAANPHLKNIQFNAKTGNHEWSRNGGEVTELRGFTHDQVELMAPGFNAVDAHVKADQKLKMYVTANNMPMHNVRANLGLSGRIGGYALPAATYDQKDISGFEKTVAKHVLNIQKEDWGKNNVINMNTRSLNHPDRAFHPTGIMVHEMGHIVGPAQHMRFGPNAQGKGVGKKGVEKFEKAFDWEAPRFSEGRHGWLKLDRSADVDPAMVDQYQMYWRMKASHPGSKSAYTKGENKGLSASRDYGRYANHLPYEDFAENFRQAVGVPMNVNDEKYSHNGKLKPEYQNSHDRWFEPLDPKGSRRKYLLDEHLSSAASNPRQYRSDLAGITSKNNRRKSATKARQTKQRKAMVRRYTKGVVS